MYIFKRRLEKLKFKLKENLETKCSNFERKIWEEVPKIEEHVQKKCSTHREIWKRAVQSKGHLETQCTN